MIDGRGGTGYCLNCKAGPIDRGASFCPRCIEAASLPGAGFEERSRDWPCNQCGKPVATDLDRFCEACIAGDGGAS